MNTTVGKTVKEHLFKLPCSKADQQEEVTIVPYYQTQYYGIYCIQPYAKGETDKFAFNGFIRNIFAYTIC